MGAVGKNDIVNLSNLCKGKIKVWDWKAANGNLGGDHYNPALDEYPWLIYT